MGYAFGSFSGGVKIEQADAHLEAGIDHLITLRANVTKIIAMKFPE